MEDITLYRYSREDRGVTVSTDKPDCVFTTLHRLIADEGMILTNGSINAYCIDTESINDWIEIADPNLIERGEENDNDNSILN